MVKILAETKEDTTVFQVSVTKGIRIPNKKGVCPYPYCHRKQKDRIKNCIGSNSCTNLVKKKNLCMYSILIEIGQTGKDFVYIIGNKDNNFLNDAINATRYIISTYELKQRDGKKDLKGDEGDVELKALLLNYYLNNYKTVTFRASSALVLNRLISKARNLKAEPRLINSQTMKISFIELGDIKKEFFNLIQEIKFELNALIDQLKELSEGNLKSFNSRDILASEEEIDALSWGIYKTALWNNILIKTSSVSKAKENIIFAASAKIAERIGDKIEMITNKFLAEVVEYLKNNQEGVKYNGELNDILNKFIEILKDELAFIEEILSFVEAGKNADGKKIKIMYDDTEKKLRELNSRLDNINIPRYLVRRTERLLIWTWRILANLYTMYFWTVSMRDPA